MKVGSAGSFAPRPESPDRLVNLTVGAGAGAGLAVIVVLCTVALLVVRRRSARAVWVHLRNGDADVLVLGQVADPSTRVWRRGLDPPSVSAQRASGNRSPTVLRARTVERWRLR